MYDQITLEPEKLKNRFTQIISPYPEDEGIWIHQDAWFHLGDFDAGETQTYNFRKTGNGLYVFVLEGSCQVAGLTLDKRDGLGILGTESIEFQMEKPGRLLLMEVPMAN